MKTVAKFNGRDILPKQYNADNFGKKVSSISELTDESVYAILDLGIDTWQVGYGYDGKKGANHIFKSVEQFDEDTIEVTDQILKEMIEDGEIYEIV